MSLELLFAAAATLGAAIIGVITSEVDTTRPAEKISDKEREIYRLRAISHAHAHDGDTAGAVEYAEAADKLERQEKPKVIRP